MLYKKLTVFTLFILIQFNLLNQNLSAQILNVEKFQSSISDTVNYFNLIALNGNITQIEKTVYNLKSSTFSMFSFNEFKYLVLSDIDLIFVDGTRVVSNGYIHFRTTFKPKSALKYELFAQEQFDAVRGLKRRDLIGFDLRFDLVSDNKMDISFASGFMYEYEWWQNLTAKEIRSLIKSTSSIQLSIPVLNSFRIHSTGYIQFVPNKPQFPRLILDSRLTWDLSEKLKLGLSQNVFYDAKPIIEIDPWVSKTRIELIIQF